jgi:hypothetical protein
VCAAALLGSLAYTTAGHGETIVLDLQRRDPQTGALTVESTAIDVSRLGVVVVDIWNWHWCKTAAARVNSFVPRMNGCLDILRAEGATIFVCPTDVVDAYVGLPQRERALDVELLPLPEPQSFACPDPPNGPGCACLQRCRGNYGWNKMNPHFVLGEDDLMPNSRAALYTLAKQRDITHLLYMGVHTQVCLLGKDVGLRNMKADGTLAAESPVMRFMHPSWRFDVAIPRETKQIVLATMPTEDGNREDLANWVNAGFVTAQ